MTAKRHRVGIVGLQPGRSWAAKAHLPALRALADRFDVIGVANTSHESAQKATEAMDIPRAFKTVAELVASPDIDIVTITVRVPHHFETVKAAIENGKHVYCEWPLGNGLQEAETLAALAASKGVLCVVGTQAVVAPEIQYLKHLIADGYVGDVLSTTLVARGGGWGGTIPDRRYSEYLLDRTNGATMLTIPLGHTLAAVTDVLGAITELSAALATRRRTARVADTGETIQVSAPDQVLASALINDDVPLSIHYRGGMPRGGAGMTWEINGTDGDIRVTGPFGHSQMVQLALAGGRGTESSLQALDVPNAYLEGFPEDVVPGNVARLYARMADDLRDGTRTAPTFDDAVRLHKIIATIEESANVGRRLSAIASRG